MTRVGGLFSEQFLKILNFLHQSFVRDRLRSSSQCSGGLKDTCDTMLGTCTTRPLSVAFYFPSGAAGAGRSRPVHLTGWKARVSSHGSW